MADTDVFIVSDTQVVPEDPNCSPCAIKRRLNPWPFSSQESLGLVGILKDTLPAVWQPDTFYAQGATVVPSNLDPQTNPFVYLTSLGGVSGSNEPNWPGNFGGVWDGNNPLGLGAGVLWGAIYSAYNYESQTILRMAKTALGPVQPLSVYDYDVYLTLKTGPNCPTATGFILRGPDQATRPAFVDASGEDVGLVFLSDFQINPAVAQDFIDDPFAWDFIFNGHENTDKSYADSSGLYLFSDYSSPIWVDDDGLEVSEVFFYEVNTIRNYFYIYVAVASEGLCGTFTFAVKKNGVLHSSIKFNYTIDSYPVGFNGVKPRVYLNSIVGDFFGQVGSNAIDVYTCENGCPLESAYIMSVFGDRPTILTEDTLAVYPIGIIADMQDMKLNAGNWDVVFDGNVNTSKSTNGSGTTAYTYDPGGGFGTGFAEFFPNPWHKDAVEGYSYFYFVQTGSPNVVSHTIEIRHLGVTHSSMTFCASRDIYGDEASPVTMVMSDIVGTMFGAVSQDEESRALFYCK